MRGWHELGPGLASVPWNHTLESNVKVETFHCYGYEMQHQLRACTQKTLRPAITVLQTRKVNAAVCTHKATVRSRACRVGGGTWARAHRAVMRHAGLGGSRADRDQDIVQADRRGQTVDLAARPWQLPQTGCSQAWSSRRPCPCSLRTARARRQGASPSCQPPSAGASCAGKAQTPAVTHCHTQRADAPVKTSTLASSRRPT